MISTSYCMGLPSIDYHVYPSVTVPSARYHLCWFFFVWPWCVTVKHLLFLSTPSSFPGSFSLFATKYSISFLITCRINSACLFLISLTNDLVVLATFSFVTIIWNPKHFVKKPHLRRCQMISSLLVVVPWFASIHQNWPDVTAKYSQANWWFDQGLTLKYVFIIFQQFVQNASLSSLWMVLVDELHRCLWTMCSRWSIRLMVLGMGQENSMYYFLSPRGLSTGGWPAWESNWGFINVCVMTVQQENAREFNVIQRVNDDRMSYLRFKSSNIIIFYICSNRWQVLLCFCAITCPGIST